MAKKTKSTKPHLELKDATKPFMGTLSDITKSTKISKNLINRLGNNKIYVSRFIFTGFKTHIFVRNACNEMGIPCKLSADPCPSYRSYPRPYSGYACMLYASIRLSSMNTTASISFRKSYLICSSLRCMLCTGVFDKHSNVLGHVIMTTDVKELVKKMEKHAKKLSPNNKAPVISLKNGGNSLLSKSTVEELKLHLQAEEMSDLEDEDSEDDDDDEEMSSDDNASADEIEETEIEEVEKPTKPKPKKPSKKKKAEETIDVTA